MKSNKTIAFSLLLIFLCLLITLIGCKKEKNSVLNYLENAELQYEGKLQEENIITALNDILKLSKEQLKTKKYKDYTGKENQWNLSTLIYRHFVPNKKNITLGDNFYCDIKSKEVQLEIGNILERIKSYY
jgi:hypothetical protein